MEPAARARKSAGVGRQPRLPLAPRAAPAACCRARCPDAGTTTMCARSNRSFQRCHCGKPRNASAPTSSSERARRHFGAHRRERVDRVALAAARDFARVERRGAGIRAARAPASRRGRRPTHAAPPRCGGSPAGHQHDIDRARAPARRRRRAADGRSGPGRTCRRGSRAESEARARLLEERELLGRRCRGRAPRCDEESGRTGG